MTALCSHCGQPLSAYTAIVETEPANLEVLVCGHCDKVLGVVGPARGTGRRIDENVIAELLDAAMNADDDDQARTLQSVAIGQMDSQVRAIGGGDPAFFERLLTTLLERQRQRKSEEERTAAERDHGRPV